MTATLDELSQTEVLEDFRMRPEDAIRSERMVRDNLDLAVENYSDTKEKLIALDQLMEDHRGKKNHCLRSPQAEQDRWHEGVGRASSSIRA